MNTSLHSSVESLYFRRVGADTFTMIDLEVAQLSGAPEPFRRDRLTKLATTYKTDATRPDRRHRPAEDTGYILLENAGVGIYGLDLNGLVTFVNPAARRMTGWALEDLRGRTQHSMVHHSHADGRNYPREECPIYMAFHDGRTHCREDEVFWRKDGSSFPVEYTSTPVFTDGKLSGAVVVFSDISDRVRRRDWDQSRIDILKGILRGRGLDDTMNAVCDAFAAFQRGCKLSIQRAVPGGSEALTFGWNVTGGPLVKQLAITNVKGSVLATLIIRGRLTRNETAEMDEALIEISSLVESAFDRQLAFGGIS